MHNDSCFEVEMNNTIPLSCLNLRLTPRRCFGLKIRQLRMIKREMLYCHVSVTNRKIIMPATFAHFGDRVWSFTLERATRISLFIFGMTHVMFLFKFSPTCNRACVSFGNVWQRYTYPRIPCHEFETCWDSLNCLPQTYICCYFADIEFKSGCALNRVINYPLVLSILWIFSQLLRPNSHAKILCVFDEKAAKMWNKSQMD